MSDYGRYGGETRSRNRDFGGREDYSRDRNSDSIFSYGGDRDRGRDRDRNRDRDNDMGGWAGSGRTSAYDDRDRNRGSWGNDRNRERGGDNDRERHYGRDDRREGLPINETGRLIASNKVEGTTVYGSDDEKLGSIYNFMVDKYSGRVEYAVMSYGGFLGMGQRYYPLPWRMLDYDVDRGGYRINMTERDLEDAPSFDRNSEPQFNRSYGEHVHGYYGLNY